MPLPCWFDRRGSNQHGPGPITGPQRLVINQRRRERLLAEQERRETCVEHKGSIELRIAWFVPKLAKDGGKLGVHFLLIGAVKFGGSLALGDARGRWSLEKKSGLGDKLVSVVNQDVLQSSRLFGHYLLVVGVRLFVENSEWVTNDRISLEKESDWDFWDSPRNGWSSKLDDVVGG
jgi:hypothetical protein